MELPILSEMLAPGQLHTEYSEDLPDEVVGWLIGMENGGCMWIGELPAAELACAGVSQHLHDKPFLWGAFVTPGVIEVTKIYMQEAAAEYDAVRIAAGIRARVAAKMQ